ncbi:MAG: hypothetical protein M3290_04340 [Actinomycetota bacterium]|nr:hypothetical protein [Actinomycetota bacterium]
MAGRKVDLALNLLDCQIIDPQGEPSGNVDDLELEWPVDGGPPIVVALLAGPGALSSRLGGRLGRSIAALHARLSHGNPEPARISMGVVKRITHQVELTVDASDVETSDFQKWALRTIIGKIPGAGHAPE